MTERKRRPWCWGFAPLASAYLKKKKTLSDQTVPKQGEKMFRTLSTSCFLTTRSSYLRNFWVKWGSIKPALTTFTTHYQREIQSSYNTPKPAKSSSQRANAGHNKIWLKNMYRGSYGSTASHIWILMLKPQSNAPIIDLFSLYVLFSQYSSCENTQENRFFQIGGSGSHGTFIGKTKHTS